jgi:hypothetical protein
VELLGHHGVRLDFRSSMSNDIRSNAQQVPSTSETTVPPLQPTIQSNYGQSFRTPQVPMPLSQLSCPSGSTQPIANNQDQFAQQPFNDIVAWSQSPVENLSDPTIRQTILSPANEASHGTLVISASGRSKYLGPSAASEWLKDVSRRAVLEAKADHPARSH